MKNLLAVDQDTAGSRTTILAEAGTRVAAALRKVSGYFRRPVDNATSSITHQREIAVVWNRRAGKPITP